MKFMISDIIKAKIKFVINRRKRESEIVLFVEIYRVRRFQRNEKRRRERSYEIKRRTEMIGGLREVKKIRKG